MKRTRPTLNLLNKEGKQKYLSGPPLFPSELCQKLNKQAAPFHQLFDVLIVPVGDDDEKKQYVLRGKLCHEDLSPTNPSGSKNAHVGKEECKRRAECSGSAVQVASATQRRNFWACKASGMFPLMAKAAVRLLAVVTSAAAEWNWSAWGRVYQGTQPARH